MAGGGRVTIEHGVTFGSGGGRELQCDVYTPPGGVTDAPAVLIVHGGGWNQGDRSQLAGYGILLGREGYLCVASEYRLTGESPWPAQIHDVKAALRWMRANHEQLGIDPTKIAITGNSAGGHLALFAAGTPNAREWEGDGGHEGAGTEVAAAMAFYPPTIFGEAFDEPRGAITASALLLDAATPEAAAAASPLSYVTPDFPPSLFIHGNRDELVPPAASTVMYDALVEQGVAAELYMFADQPHGFDAASAYGRQSAQVMKLFLDRYVAETVPRVPELVEAAT